MSKVNISLYLKIYLQLSYEISKIKSQSQAVKISLVLSFLKTSPKIVQMPRHFGLVFVKGNKVRRNKQINGQVVATEPNQMWQQIQQGLSHKYSDLVLSFDKEIKRQSMLEDT